MEEKMKQVEFLTTKALQESLNQDLSCDSESIKKVIQKWCEAHFWKFENFAEFLSLMELQPPFIIRTNTDPSYVPAKREYCYECITQRGLVLISFFYSSCEIKLIEKNVEKVFQVNPNNYKILDHPPFFYLKKKTIRVQEKKLCHEMTNAMYHCSLQIGQIHSLKVDISLDKALKDILLTSPLQNERLEKYLLGLSHPVNIFEVYESLNKLLGFSSTNRFPWKKLCICYYEVMFTKKEKRAIILVEDGILKEIGVLKGDKTYHSYINGNWEYLSPNIYYSFDKKTNRYTQVCNRDDLDNKILETIEEEIRNLPFL